MEGRKNKQSGFSIVEIVLVVAVIGVIGAAGWLAYLYHHSHYKFAAMFSTANTSAKSQASTSKQNTTPASTNTSAGSQTSTNKNTTPSTTSYFTIKEWGVRAPYNGPLILQYVVSDSNNLSLSSSQFAAGGPALCAADGNSDAGILGRSLPTDSNLAPNLPPSETAEQYVDQNPLVPHAKIGNYIYIYWGNGYLKNGVYKGPCTDKTVCTQTILAFSALVPKLQAVQK